MHRGAVAVDSGVLALIIAPALAFAGVALGKWVDNRRNGDDRTTNLIKALQAEVERRDKVSAETATAHAAALSFAQRQARRFEDYCHALRRALSNAGHDVPEWPEEVPTS